MHNKVCTWDSEEGKGLQRSLALAQWGMYKSCHLWVINNNIQVIKTNWLKWKKEEEEEGLNNYRTWDEWGTDV